jgi:hypothetical protein
LVTRAVIAAVSIGTFALLVIGMAPGRPATDPAHLDDTLGTSSTVVGAAATGSTSAALVAVTYIGRLSASLHDPTASASPPAPGRFGVTP